MNHKFALKPLTLAIFAALSGVSAVNVQAVTLQEVTVLAIKNSPKIMTEGINVKLKGADKDIAYKFFDPKLEASFQTEKLGGFGYPSELELLSLNSLGSITGLPNTAFIPDNSRTEDLKLALTKIFLNGLYTQVGVNLTQKTSDKDMLNASSALNQLNLTGFQGGGLTLDNYFPLTYGVVKFVTRIPLWGRGDLSEAIGDYTSKEYKFQAALANMNYAISSILASAVYAYWDNRAALARYEIRKASFERVKKWQQRINEVVDHMPNGKAIRAANASELGRITGFVEEKRKDFNTAETELNDSRAALANSIGIPLKKAKEIGDATDTIPSLASEDGINPDAWNDLALEKRFDLKAFRLEDQAATELLNWMIDYNKPELNVIMALHQQMATFGQDAASGFENALKNFSGDLGYTAGIQFTMKLDNSAGRGRATQATLNKMKNQIDLDSAVRKTAIDLKGLADKLKTSISTAKSANQSAAAYRQSVEAAQSDKRQTFETAFRQFDTERYWANAEADRVNAEAALAKVIIEIRHQTGTLVNPAEGDNEVSLQDMVTLPKKQ